MNKLKKMFLDFIEDSQKMWEAYQRGTVAPIGFLAPLAIMAAAKLVKGGANFVAKRKAGKEQKRAGEEQAQANFETQRDTFENNEDARQARARFVGSQLTGARALSPEVLAQAVARRRNTARKGATIDPTKGLGFQALGDAAGTVGEFANAYMAGNNPNSNAVSGDDASNMAGRIHRCPDGSYGTNC